jgi:hypothetical protein
MVSGEQLWATPPARRFGSVGELLQAASPPSDTTVLRLSEQDLVEQGVHLRHSMNRDVQMVPAGRRGAARSLGSAECG